MTEKLTVTEGRVIAAALTHGRQEEADGTFWHARSET
jgi:hypothetical protein